MSTWDDAVRNVENLTTVVKGQDAKYYDVYFDPTPKDVTIPKLNDDDTIGTVTIPNVAKLNQIFETWKGTVQPNIAGINAVLGNAGAVGMYSTAATGSITSSSGYDKVTHYHYDLSSANASDPSTSIVTSASVTTITTPISLVGFYPILGGFSDLWDILGPDTFKDINFAKIEGTIVFTDSFGNKRCLNTEFDHDKDDVVAISNYSAGYTEAHPEWSEMDIIVAEKGELSHIWIKPVSGIDVKVGLHLIA